MLTMVDLFSGFGGASAAMRVNGWRVVRVDLEPLVKPDVVADVSNLPVQLDNTTLVWASPPCTFYSRYAQRASLFHDEPLPSLELFEASQAAVIALAPAYWVIENVAGAVPFHGKPQYKFGPYHLWTNIPLMLQPVWDRVRKADICGGQAKLRGQRRGYIPYGVSDAVRLSVEYLVSQGH